MASAWPPKGTAFLLEYRSPQGQYRPPEMLAQDHGGRSVEAEGGEDDQQPAGDQARDVRARQRIYAQEQERQADFSYPRQDESKWMVATGARNAGSSIGDARERAE